MAKFCKKVNKCKKKKYKKGKKSGGKGLKRMIKKVLSRAIETKTVTERQLTPEYIVPVISANWVNNIFALGPYAGSLPINQGTGQGDRIGNVIQTVRGVWKGSIFPMPYDGTFNTTPQPSMVKLVIFREKANPNSMPNPGPAPGSADIFQSGSGHLPFQNNLSDLWLPYNTDKYQILKTKIYKVGNSVSPGTGGAGSTDNQNFSNNDFKMNVNFHINYTKFLQKKIRFQDNSAVPQKALYGMWTVVSAAGGALSAARIPLGYQYMQEFRFKDA